MVESMVYLTNMVVVKKDIKFPYFIKQRPYLEESVGKGGFNISRNYHVT